MEEHNADSDETISDADAIIARIEAARRITDNADLARLLAEAENGAYKIKSREQGRLLRWLRAVREQLS